EYQGLNPIFEVEVGSGRMIYLGFDFWAYQDVHAQLIGNALSYLSSFTDGELIFDTEFPLNIPPSGSVEITVTTDADGMLAGDYFTDITFQTNDPDNTTLDYVIAVEVTGEPLPSISSDEIVFPPIFNGQVAMDTLVIFNEGCEILTVEASLPDGFFAVSASSLTIEAYSNDTLFVTYSPLESGDHSEILQLITNAGDFSVNLAGSAAGAPVIVVSPENPVVDVTACADSVMVTLDVSNTGEALLEFTIGSQNSRSLEDLLLEINTNYTEITDEIPNIYFFSGGEFGNNIGDGGGDMYDGGNYLNTNLENSIAYTTGLITESSAFGENSRYFTRKVPGLFVLSADMSDVEFFRITGNLGADGSGTNQGGDLDFSFGGIDYKAFYTSTSSTFDPSINHLIIIEDSPSLTHEFLTSTSNEDHSVSGLNNSNRIYYLLFAGNSSFSTQVETMQSIFETFVEDFAAEIGFESDVSYEVASGETVQVELYIPVSGLEEGTYEFPIQILSNAPGNPLLTVPVTVEVDDTPCSFFEAIADEASCSGIVAFENQSTNSPSTILWDFGDGTTSSDENPSHTYTEAGTYTVSLTVCESGECNSTEQLIEILAVGGPVPAICEPQVFNPYFNLYFLEVSVNGESNNSLQDNEDYLDLTCNILSELNVGEESSFEISYFTFMTYTAVKAQIDFNNDGVFTTNETIYEGSANGPIQSSFTTPSGAVMGQPLRFRVMIDNNFINDCSLSLGRAIDFSVLISPIDEAPETAFTWAVLDECQRVYQFIDNSTNLPNTWNWNFGDGSSSSLQNPIHIFDEGGEYAISLAASNIFGTNVHEETLETQESGISGIGISGSATVGEPISFSAAIDGSGVLNWDFGDGNSIETTSTEVEHTYSTSGIFEVSVSTSADVCIPEFSTFLNILPLGVGDAADENGFLIYPNPSRGNITIDCPEGTSLVDISLYDAVGKQIRVIKNRIGQRQVKIEIEDPVAGMYFLLLTDTDGHVFRSRVVLE
ncbi:MAG TPA: PKD domain-containing protein, partial [Cryomorphaceae bacterium]|nr:PKD domain-containing protein [Cryomorphaceae bacterium]